MAGSPFRGDTKGLRSWTDCFLSKNYMEKQDTEVVSDGNKIYEVGYLIVSSVPVEKVASEMEAIHSLIEKTKGTIIAHESPTLRPLAYTMIKPLDGVRHRFNEGHFGWVKFELASDAITKIKTAFETNPHVLRYLLINTVRESTLAPAKPKEVKKEDVVGGEAPKEAVSVEELDKTIDDMVKEA